jgi:hypothetical protein
MNLWVESESRFRRVTRSGFGPWSTILARQSPGLLAVVVVARELLASLELMHRLRKPEVAFISLTMPGRHGDW